MAATKSIPKGSATIDVAMVTIETESNEYLLDTASKISVETSVETTEAVKLIIKGILKAQKPQVDTITGTTITLTDNVFNAEVVKILQGGTIEYDEVQTTTVIKYTPPVVGSSDKGVSFKLNAYSAQMNAAGDVERYEKITYPNCKGSPVAFNSEDNVFRTSEYTIHSAPNTGEAPYVIEYVNTLPTVV